MKLKSYFKGIAFFDLKILFIKVLNFLDYYANFHKNMIF